MHPVIAWLEVDGVVRPIGSYGVMLAVAFVAGLGSMAYAAHRARLDVGVALIAVALATAGALWGGWSLFVGVEWLKNGNPWSALRQGGLVFFGGAAGGVLGFSLAARWWRQPLGSLADAAVLPLAVAHGIGRIGCFFGGCCYGRPWSALDEVGWRAVTYADVVPPGAHLAVARHPVALYEGLLVIMLGVYLHRASTRTRSARPGRRLNHPERTDGRLLCGYFGFYALLRFALEPLRGDEVRGLWLDGRLSTSQVLAVGVLVLSWVTWSRLGHASSLPVAEVPREVCGG